MILWTKHNNIQCRSMPRAACYENWLQHEVQALQENNVIVDTYYGRSIAGSHCMLMVANGNQIMDAMSKAILPKIKDALTQSLN